MTGERTILAFFAAAVVLCSAASLVISHGGREGSTPTTSIGNLSGSLVVEVRDVSRSQVLSGQFAPRTSTVHDALRVALLVGGTGSAVGNAEIELNRHPNGVLVQELEIVVEGLSPHAAYQVVVDGQAIGVLNTDGRGAAEFERFGAVPDVPVRSGD
jgi:hypothetical protein